MPLPVIAENICGSSVTTSTRSVTAASPVGAPLDHHLPALEIHPLHDRAHPRDEARALAGDLHHVLRAIRDPLRDRAQPLALLVQHLETQQVDEVVIPFALRGQGFAGPWDPG